MAPVRHQAWFLKTWSGRQHKTKDEIPKPYAVFVFVPSQPSLVFWGRVLIPRHYGLPISPLTQGQGCMRNYPLKEYSLSVVVPKNNNGEGINRTFDCNVIAMSRFEFWSCGGARIPKWGVQPAIVMTKSIFSIKSASFFNVICHTFSYSFAIMIKLWVIGWSKSIVYLTLWWFIRNYRSAQSDRLRQIGCQIWTINREIWGCSEDFHQF